MRASWQEIDRFPAAPGCLTRHAVEWFARDSQAAPGRWQWQSEDEGTFEADGRTFRIRLGGPDSDQWVIEELKASRGRHA
jgi:hypothetical protein